MNRQIFREKSIRQISSPEELSDYVRTAGPGAWLCLTAVLVLLAGICVWGVFGRLDTTLSAAAVVEDGVASLLIPEGEADRLAAGMPVAVGEAQGVITSLSALPEVLPAGYDPALLHLAGLGEGDWIYRASVPVDLPDGVYTGVVTIERVAPVSFVLN